MPRVLLDISRTVARVASGRHSGIDRVETAYIRHFLDSDAEVAFLVRIRRWAGFLDRTAMRDFLRLAENNGPWTKRRGIFGGRGPLADVRATLCKLAQPGYPRAGFVYINVGHGNLPPLLWPALRRAGATKIIGMIHDVIPLDYPQYVLAKTRKRFAAQMRDFMRAADIVLCNSEDTAQRLEPYLQEWGCAGKPVHVLHLGLPPLTDAIASLDIDHPYFVALGTIEPRKNHALLLDIWAAFYREMDPADMPRLYIIGARGWMCEAEFGILDTAPFMGKSVVETGHIPDIEMRRYLAGARALLFPSFAEGFGLPVLEALQSGVPVLCNDLPCLREIAGDFVNYLDVRKPDIWRAEIEKLTRKPANISKNLPNFPNWQEHFRDLAVIVGP